MLPFVKCLSSLQYLGEGLQWHHRASLIVILSSVTCLCRVSGVYIFSLYFGNNSVSFAQYHFIKFLRPHCLNLSKAS